MPPEELHLADSRKVLPVERLDRVRFRQVGENSFQLTRPLLVLPAHDEGAQLEELVPQRRLLGWALVLVLLVVQELRCRKEENASGGFRIVLPSIMMVELSRVGMALTWLSCLLRKVLDSLTSL